MCAVRKTSVELGRCLWYQVVDDHGFSAGCQAHVCLVSLAYIWFIIFRGGVYFRWRIDHVRRAHLSYIVDKPHCITTCVACSISTIEVPNQAEFFAQWHDDIEPRIIESRLNVFGEMLVV